MNIRFNVAVWFSVVSENWKSQCVRLKVTVKSDNCGESQDCSGKGVCYTNVSMVCRRIFWHKCVGLDNRGYMFVGRVRVSVLPRLRGPALRGARRVQSITLLEQRHMCGPHATSERCYLPLSMPLRYYQHLLCLKIDCSWHARCDIVWIRLRQRWYRKVWPYNMFCYVAARVFITSWTY